MKILSTNLEFEKRELEYVVQYAVELRQRVRDWLYKLSPGEFPKETLSYRLRT